MKKRFFIVGLLIILLSSSLLFFLKKPPLLDGIDFSKAVYDQQHQLLRVTLTTDEKYRLFVPLSAISQTMIAATLLKEDKDFYQHSGVSLVALTAAFWQTYIMQGQRRGASTIVMQLAKLRYGINSRSIFGKIHQLFLALQLEYFYSKTDILTAYFNLAPYGNNIEGVEAASLIYYHHSARDLTLPQALTLSVIPQNPIKRTLDKKDDTAILAARQNLFIRWIAEHPQDAQYQNLINLPLNNMSRRDLSFLAPHFVNQVLQTPGIKHGVLVTSLNLYLQKLVEKTIQQYLIQKKSTGIVNASAMLVDTHTMNVKVLVGSSDFFNRDIQGQVNGSLANRSPGSTLKPFIYGLAIDQGLIHPATILKDTPTSFGNYDPENFDNQFLGPLSAQDSLLLSRNIPAIYLAAQLKNPTLYQFLTQAGVTLKSEQHYGLALVLGGAEMNMQQLVSLYAMLANQGEYHALNFLANTPLDDGKRLLSREASFMVLKMLDHKDRPNQINLPNIPPSFPVAWKTGTSSGYRDGWVVGVFDHYVLAVWIGNFSEPGNKAFTGFDGAAPLFFNILNVLSKPLAPLQDTTANWQKLKLTQVTVCTDSGMLATTLCPHRSKTWFIPGKSPIEKDTVYREVMINPKTGLRSCHFNPNNKFVTYEFWTSDILNIFQQAGIAKRTPPRYEAGCEMIDNDVLGAAPKIVTPKSTINYVINYPEQTQAKIPLSALAESDVDTLYWFANDSYIGKSKPNKVLWWLANTGNYQLRVVDDYGRLDLITVTVSAVAKP